MSELPKFIPDSATDIVTELVQAWENETGKTLQPAQIERLLINLWAYREALVRAQINDAARQNLLAFARAPMLDYLGELVGVTRLPAQPAVTTVRLTFASALSNSLLIPAFVRVESNAGVQYQTLVDYSVKAGQSYVDIFVSAVEAGIQGNGLVAGQINTLIDDIGVSVSTVANLTVSVDGTDAEGDEHLRERIRLAPETFTVAGSKMSYQQHAMAAHPDIVDVAVKSQSPGVVALYPLVKTGLPSTGILDLVVAATGSDKVRPITDTVQVLSPVQYNYQIQAQLTVFTHTDVATVRAAALSSINAFVAKHQATLGQDVVPSQIIAALSVAGVYRVELISPVAVLSIPAEGWAHNTLLDVQIVGVNNG